MPTHRLFLLSPASMTGLRAQLMQRATASFPLAQQLRSRRGAALGDVFTFLSGLYFRGKLAYARAFASPPPGMEGAYIITSNRGLLAPDCLIRAADLSRFARVPINVDEPKYRRPLERDALALAQKLPNTTEFVLLGSISTAKYVDVLLAIFGARLVFPRSFVGRGDMSRGGLMLRSVADRQELEYMALAGALRRGKRPPKLEPRTWKGSPFAEPPKGD